MNLRRRVSGARSVPHRNAWQQFTAAYARLLDIVVVRLIFAITLTLVAIYSHPFGFRGPFAVGVGIASAAP